MKPPQWNLLVRPGAFSAVLLAVVVAGCSVGGSARLPGPPPSSSPKVSHDTLPETARIVGEGIASWYGGKFHGRRTASGEIYNKWDRTAAHRTLPLGTRLVVERISTGQRVTVRVNDRGPFVDGRIIDLSRGAADQLGMVAQGTARVRLYDPKGTLKTRESPTKADSASFFVQVGSFENRRNAVRLKRRLEDTFNVYITRAYDRYHRVRVGPFAVESRAEDAARRLRDHGLESWTVRDTRENVTN